MPGPAEDGRVSAAAAHELRVLDGLHAGARAPLDDAQAQPLAIGSALDNDIVLGDPGIAARHALLHWDAAQRRWRLQPAAEAEAAPAAARDAGHGLGEAVSLGPVRITVASANDPFDAVVAAPAVQAPVLVDEPPPGEAAELTPAPAPAAPAPRWGRIAALLALVITLALGAGLWHVQQLAGERAAALPQRPAPARPQPSAAVPAVDPIQAALRPLALERQLAVRQVGGRPVVTGLVADAAAQEAVSSALLRLSPRPGLQVLTLADLRAQARDAGWRLPDALRLSLTPEGGLRVAGPVGTDADGAELARRLQALLPPGVALATDFEPPQRLAERFLAAAREQGFAIDGRLDGARLVAQLDLPDADRARWERWLLQAHPRLLGSLRLAVALREAPPAPRSDLRLPFRVASVVGGAAPQLLLADGTRLLPGGRVGDVTLERIDDDRLVLRRGAQTFEVPR